MNDGRTELIGQAIFTAAAIGALLVSLVGCRSDKPEERKLDGTEHGKIMLGIDKDSGGGE